MRVQTRSQASVDSRLANVDNARLVVKEIDTGLVAEVDLVTARQLFAEQGRFLGRPLHFVPPPEHSERFDWVLFDGGFGGLFRIVRKGVFVIAGRQCVLEGENAGADFLESRLIRTFFSS
jgi:hypothetical protein